MIYRRHKGMSHADNRVFWTTLDWTMTDSQLSRLHDQLQSTVLSWRIRLMKPDSPRKGEHLSGDRQPNRTYRGKPVKQKTP